jgi:hypothetical protein
VKLSRDLPLTERNMLAALAYMDGDTRAVARELLTDARISGLRTFNPLIEGLRAMTPLEHKTFTDRIRKRLGLKTSDDCDWNQ